MITAGTFQNEASAAEAFDQLIDPTGFFNVHREVRGDLIQPRTHQEDKRVRIDRILVPTSKLTGWQAGCIGIEFKRSEMKIGRPISQMLDYSRALWKLSRGISVGLNFVFLWPCEKQNGDIASILTQQRLGTVVHRFNRLDFFSGEVRVLTINSDGSFSIGNTDCGQMVGSR